MSDDTIRDDQTRGETSQSGFADSEVPRNPDQPTSTQSRGKGAQEITISPEVGDTSEDLIDRIDDDAPAPRRT